MGRVLGAVLAVLSAATPAADLVPHEEPYPGYAIGLPRGWTDASVPGGPLTFTSATSPTLTLRVQRQYFDGDLARLEEAWRDAQSRDGVELSASRAVLGKAGRFLYVGARAQDGKPVRVHAGLYVDRRRAFVVSLTGPASVAGTLRALAGPVLASFEPRAPQPAPLLLAAESGAALKLQPPLGWACRPGTRDGFPTGAKNGEAGGLLAVLPGRGPLAQIRVHPIPGVAPYDALLKRELAKFPPPALPVHGPLDLIDGRVTLYRAPITSEGRRMAMVWTIAGTPGKYLEIAFLAEPELFDVYLPVALRSLETLRRD